MSIITKLPVSTRLWLAASIARAYVVRSRIRRIGSHLLAAIAFLLLLLLGVL
jgi:hypothetical protein